MAQHDYVIENQSGAAFRADLNNGLAAIVSQNSGTSQPSTTYAYQWWADTTTGLLKIRNAANNAWVTVGTLADVNLGLLSLAGGTLTGALLLDDSGTVSAPALAFDGDDNTGIFRSAADTLNVATNGIERVEFGTSEVVFNDGGANYDFRIEGDTNSSLFFVDASAEAVGIGTSSVDRRFVVSDSTDNNLPTTVLTKTVTGGGNSGLHVHTAGTDAGGGAYGFRVTSGSTYGSPTNELFRVDVQGRLLVGTSSSTASAAAVFQGFAGSATGQGIINLQVGKNTAATAVNEVLGSVRFANSDGNIGAQIAGEADLQWNSGDYPSRLVFSTTADGASSPTERMRITSAGDALFGKTAFSTTTNGVIIGDLTGNSPVVVVTNTEASDTTAPLIVNRQTSDGRLVQFRHANTTEGTISVSGTTVTYGGGHLARWSQLPNDEDPSNILKGTIMSNLDEMCEWGEEDNEQLNKTKVSDVEGDPNVAGVFVSTSFDDEGPADFFVAMTGDMIIRIAEGVTVQRGDLLMSAGDGTAKPQDDDIIRSKTIAKVTSTHVTCTYDDGSYCVPCVLMAC
jgi:hypothetical protein